ncbi:MAG TPA: hypothetical protein VN622_12285 [Clostridia bacterium]|nr:hypothetical protein [Clostridia bacterium]
MTEYLYLKMVKETMRTWQVLALATMVLICAPFGQAQYRAKPKPRTSPRAVAVLEILPGGAARLFPVSLLLDGRFYDASLYAAKPAPMSLYVDTVYEAQKTGTPVGLFTVAGARRMGDLWWGEGTWTPFASGESKDAAQDKTAGQSGEVTVKTATTDKPKLKDDDDPDRPVLKKPPAQNAPEDKAKTPQTAGTAPKSAEKQPDDPDRPTLRRGRSTHNDEPVEPPTMTLKPGTPMAKPIDVMVAVSDPDPTQGHPFDFLWSDQEKQRYTREMTSLAAAELRKFSAGRNGPMLPTSFTFTEESIRALDVDYSNSPELVFTGRYAVPGGWKAAGAASAREFELYVTVIGRPDYDSNVHKGFAVATDSAHLDAYPRLELVDGVDADGDGRGDLLFRRITDVGRSYILYRVYSGQVQKMFEGGSGQ